MRRQPLGAAQARFPLACAGAFASVSTTVPRAVAACLRQGRAALLLLARALRRTGRICSPSCRSAARQMVIHAKVPFGGPQQVRDYLGRYTHRVAMSNTASSGRPMDALPSAGRIIAIRAGHACWGGRARIYPTLPAACVTARIAVRPADAAGLARREVADRILKQPASPVHRLRCAGFSSLDLTQSDPSPTRRILHVSYIASALRFNTHSPPSAERRSSKNS